MRYKANQSLTALDARALQWDPSDPTGERVAALALSQMVMRHAGAGTTARSSRHPAAAEELEKLAAAKVVESQTLRDARQSLATTSAAVRRCTLDAPSSKVVRVGRVDVATLRRTPRTRRLAWTPPREPPDPPFDPAFDSFLARPIGPPVSPGGGLAPLPNIVEGAGSGSGAGTGWVYRWRYVDGPSADAFGGDPFYDECVDQAVSAHRPAFVHLLPPRFGETYGSFAAMFVQDDDAAFESTGAILRKPPEGLLPELVVDDLAWFAAQLQAAADPLGGAAEGWRPISIAAARYSRPLGLLGPVVEKTDYAVAWLRDGLPASDHRVQFSAPGALEADGAALGDLGFRPISGVRTVEGSVTLWVRNEQGFQWVIRDSMAAFITHDEEQGYRPIHIGDGLVIGVRQTDDSVSVILQPNVNDVHDLDEVADTFVTVKGLDYLAPCFGLEGDQWAIAAYKPRRGTSGLPTFVGTPDDELQTAGDIELDRWLREDIMATKDIGAAVLAVARDGETVLHRAYTFGAMGDRPTELDTPFRVASVSKTITAVAVMRLLDEHPNLNLDTPVFDVLGMPTPVDYPDEVREIRIRDLLQHRCGWGRNAGQLDPADPEMPPPEEMDDDDAKDGPFSLGYATWIADLGVPFDYFRRSQIVDYGLNIEASFDSRDKFGFIPGDIATKFRYSNFGYILLAQLVEAVSAFPYAQFVKQRILDPLGMTSTYVGTTERYRVGPREPLYQGDRRYFGDVLADDSDAFAPSNLGLLNDSAAPNLPLPYGGKTLLETADGPGAWVSTAYDMIRFLRAFDGVGAGGAMVAPGGEEILTPGTAATMFSSSVLTPGSFRYACGWYAEPLQTEGGVVIPGVTPAYFHGGNYRGTFALIARRATGSVFMAFSRNRLQYYTPSVKALSAIPTDG